MSDSNNGVVLVAFLWITTIAISIFSGFLAWDWVEPESFWGAIGFLLLWGILSTIGHYIALGIAAIFGGIK